VSMIQISLSSRSGLDRSCKAAEGREGSQIHKQKEETSAPNEARCKGEKGAVVVSLGLSISSWRGKIYACLSLEKQLSSKLQDVRSCSMLVIPCRDAFEITMGKNLLDQVPCHSLVVEFALASRADKIVFAVWQ